MLLNVFRVDSAAFPQTFQHFLCPGYLFVYAYGLSLLLVNQLLRLSSHSKKEPRIAEQIKSLTPPLDAFGNAKTLMNL